MRVGGSSLIRCSHSLSSGITPGRVTMKHTTHPQIAASKAFKYTGAPRKYIEGPPRRMMSVTAVHLARGLMTPCFCQFDIRGP